MSQRIVPFIGYEDAAGAIEWLEQAFGFREQRDQRHEHGQDVIAIRPIMNLTLTYDHRLVDGALAGRFLKDLREALETWDEVAY